MVPSWIGTVAGRVDPQYIAEMTQLSDCLKRRHDEDVLRLLFYQLSVAAAASASNSATTSSVGAKRRRRRLLVVNVNSGNCGVDDFVVLNVTPDTTTTDLLHKV